MAHELDDRVIPFLSQLDSEFPMQDYAITIVIMDQREGKNDEVSVYGNRLGHGKYHILEHALEQEDRTTKTNIEELNQRRQ